MHRAAVLVLLLPLLASFAAASAQALAPPSLPFDPTPQAPNAVLAEHDFRLSAGLDAFQVVSRFDVHEVEIHAGQGISAQAIRDGGPAAHDLFEARVRALLDSELRKAFPDANPLLGEVRFQYGSTNADADPYQPPILVEAVARVPLTPTLLGFSSLRFTDGPDLARAFLYSGGRALLDRGIAVPPGFSSRIAVSVPDFMRLDGPAQPNATRVVFPSDNTDGAVPQTLRLRFGLGLRPEHVPPSVLSGPVVRATFVAHDDTPLWLQALPFASGRYHADLDLWIDLPSLGAKYFGASPLPPNLRAEQLSADVLRIAIRERIVGESELHAFFADLITEGLEEGFGESAEVVLDEAAFHNSLQRPLGGGDGRSVEPILVHATARLPLQSDKMVMGSSLARTLGLITGIPADFPISNTGSWGLELALLYPEGVSIDVDDKLGRSQKIEDGNREGFQVVLAAGESTQMQVHGRPAFEPFAILIGLLELGLLTVFALWLGRRIRRAAAGKRFPWSSAGRSR